MKKTLRTLFLWVVTGVMLLSFVACKSNEPTTQNTTTATVAPEGDTTKATSVEVTEVKTLSLVMYTDWYLSGWQALEKYINDNSAELGFELDIQKIAGGDQGDQLLTVKYATGELPDLIQTYGKNWIDRNAHGIDKMVDLTGMDMSAYEKSIIDSSYVFDGKLLSIPVGTVNLSGILYNKEVFKTVGVEIPKTWDELLAACEKFKAAGITPIYGSFKDTWTSQLLPLAGLTSDVAESGKTFNEFMNDMNTNVVKFADSTNFIDTIKRGKELIDKGYINETYLSDTYDGAQAALAEGTAAMYVNATWTMDSLLQKYPDQKDNIGAFAQPTVSGDNYTNVFLPFSLGVTTACKDVELAKKAIAFIASDEAQQIFADAQSGIYLNKNVVCELPAAMADLRTVMDSGKGMVDWEGEVLYPYGNLGEYMINYYAGGDFKDPADVAKAMDSESAKNAKSKSDPNWN